MQRETIRVGLKKTKNFQSYEATIEKEIFYKDSEERTAIVQELYAICRKDIAKQIELDGVRK